MNCDQKVLLLDAAMGKDLKMRGVPIPDTIWSANALLVAPGAVLDIHRENIDAGCDIITTNTYSIIRGDLAKEGIEHRYQELNEQAAALAREAVDGSARNVSIAGALPPLNGSFRADRVATYDLLGVMVNCCLPERISEAMATLAAAGLSRCGGYANAFTRIPDDWLLDGDKDTDGALELRDDLPPDVYVRFASQWLEAGANIIGGCCGTLASHTAALRRLIDH